jgi:hypothetical protein
MKLHASCAVLVGQLLILSTGFPTRPTHVADVPPRPTYSEVIDRAFQFSSGIPSEFKGVERRIVLRYIPSFGAPESQTVILKGPTGKLRIIQYRLKPGAKPISEQYNEALRENPRSSVEDILRNVIVQRSERPETRLITELFKELDDLSVPTNLSPDLCVDGTVLEIWIQTPSNEIRASFSDCAYGKRTVSTPVIKWMKAIRAMLN